VTWTISAGELRDLLSGPGIGRQYLLKGGAGDRLVMFQNPPDEGSDIGEFNPTAPE
jgi:hypothetical protein